ncbi:MAG: SDR family NAD(P)-dependent oxidoreductase [Thermoplasmata archaeon]|nr:SDR family NAD(P)-dependent oxidoreductase [Thermoplasmata archaeon]
MPDPEPPYLITGATGAVGAAVARALARERKPLVLWTRTRTGGQSVCETLRAEFPDVAVRLVDGDLGHMSSVRKTAAELELVCPRLGAIIHCAGVLTRLREETPEGLERMFATNHLGPFLLTRMLCERLERARPTRIVFVSAASAAPIHFEDLQSRRTFRALPAFASSKTAQLLFAFALARRFSSGPWTSNVFFPGVVRSGLLREAPWIVRAFSRAVGSAADRAGDSLAWVATAASLASANGQFFEGTRIGSTPDYVQDVGRQERLWEASERILSTTQGHAG